MTVQLLIFSETGSDLTENMTELLSMESWKYCFETGSDETRVDETVVFETGKMRALFW